MNNLTIAQLIQSGAQDHELDAIEQALRSRREAKVSTMRGQLRSDQDIWLTNTTGTQYLRGRHAKVVEVNRVRAVIKLVNPRVGERFQGRFTCPLDIITDTKPSYAVD